MSRLTDPQVVTIAEAAVLMRQHETVLSEFERDLIAEISARFVEFGRASVITPAEWLPFSDAVAAMRAAQARAANLDRALNQAAFLAHTRAA